MGNCTVFVSPQCFSVIVGAYFWDLCNVFGGLVGGFLSGGRRLGPYIVPVRQRVLGEGRREGHIMCIGAFAARSFATTTFFRGHRNMLCGSCCVLSPVLQSVKGASDMFKGSLQNVPTGRRNVPGLQRVYGSCCLFGDVYSVISHGIPKCHRNF